MGEIIDGQPLFPGESEIDQLYLIQKVLGPLTPGQQEVFQKNPRYLGLKFPEISRLETIEKRFLKLEGKALDFLYRLLKMEPGERMTAAEALMHPYLNESYERPQTTASVSRADSAGTRGRYQSNVAVVKNKRGILMSNPIGEGNNNRKQVRMKEEGIAGLQLKEVQFAVPEAGRSGKSTTNKDNTTARYRSSPFANEILGEAKEPGKIDRQRSKEGIKHAEMYIEAKPLRGKKKSNLEDNLMFNINEEEDMKVSPRLKPVSIKKKTTKIIYPQEVQHGEYVSKNLRSGIFNRGLPKNVAETHAEVEDVSNHQSARQLPNIYGHYHAEPKRGRQKEDDPDIGGGPQYMNAFQNEDYMHFRQNKNHNHEYKPR